MTIYCYHSVDDDWPSRLSVPTDDFAAQCRWVAENRRVLPLDVVARQLNDRFRLPAGQAAITFDDGWAGVHDRAWPILRRHGLPFTVFVVTDTLADDPMPATWVDDPGGGTLATLTRDQVLEMAQAGVDIASHSRRHADLTTLSAAECLDDLRHSREFLEDLLGREVTAVAYPRGRHDEMVRSAARKAGYRYGFALPEHRYVPGRHAIPRVGVYPGNSLGSLRIKSAPRYLDVRLSPVYTAGFSAMRRARRRIKGRAA